MKKAIIFLLLVSLIISTCTIVVAEGMITYDGDAKKFIYGYESKDSPTDLFEDFKNVMPGDSITQKLTVKNNASNDVKVKIYLRSLGAKEESKDFLSKLHMTVAKSSENEMAYMFDASADKTASLTDWVLLGTLYCGGEVNLDITLDVPIDLDNEYEDAVGYIDWQFKIEEFPVEDTDPLPPQTGDDFKLGLYAALACLCGLMIVFLLTRKRKDLERANNA